MHFLHVNYFDLARDSKGYNINFLPPRFGQPSFKGSCCILYGENLSFALPNSPMTLSELMEPSHITVSDTDSSVWASETRLKLLFNIFSHSLCFSCNACNAPSRTIRDAGNSCVPFEYIVLLCGRDMKQWDSCSTVLCLLFIVAYTCSRGKSMMITVPTLFSALVSFCSSHKKECGTDSPLCYVPFPKQEMFTHLQFQQGTLM